MRSSIERRDQAELSTAQGLELLAGSDAYFFDRLKTVSHKSGANYGQPFHTLLRHLFINDIRMGLNPAIVEPRLKAYCVVRGLKAYELGHFSRS